MENNNEKELTTIDQNLEQEQDEKNKEISRVLEQWYWDKWHGGVDKVKRINMIPTTFLFKAGVSAVIETGKSIEEIKQSSIKIKDARKAYKILKKLKNR